MSSLKDTPKPQRNLVTTQITAMVDDRDNYIHEQILKIFYHQNAVTIVDFFCPDGSWDRLHPALFNAGLSLVKANAHRRNFHKLLPDSRKWADGQATEVRDKV